MQNRQLGTKRHHPRPFLQYRAVWTVAALALLSTPVLPGTASAQSTEERIRSLEERLDQVLGAVQEISAELKALRERQAKLEGSTPVAKIEPSERMANIERSVEETSQRVNDVEDLVFDLDEKVGSRAVAHAFDAESLDIGGFLHSALTYADGEDGSAISLNRLTFELLAKAQLSKKWSLFAAQAFIRESGTVYSDPFQRRDPGFQLQSKAPLVIATATYEHSDAFEIDIGRYITPHGIINIEHFPALLLDPEQPQFLRPFGGQTIFANFMNGLRFSGEFYDAFGGGGSFGYQGYLGNFAGNAEVFNYGGRLYYKAGNSGFTFGVNAGGGKRAGGDSEYTLVGADLLYDKGPILVKSELFATDEDLGGDRLAFYAQPAFRFGDGWTVFYRYDFLDDGTNTGDKTEHAVGLTFRPIPQVHLRGIFRLNKFGRAPGIPSADSQSYQLLATYSF